MKYGIIVRVTEEFLSQFLSESVLNNHVKLINAVKPIIAENWNIPPHEVGNIKCKVQYKIENDTFLFRLRSERPIIYFVAISEGMEYSQVGWFGK
jgi:hypothetical protein